MHNATHTPAILTAADLDAFALDSGAVLCPVPGCRGELAEAGDHKHSCDDCCVGYLECACGCGSLIESGAAAEHNLIDPTDGRAYCDGAWAEAADDSAKEAA